MRAQMVPMIFVGIAILRGGEAMGSITISEGGRSEYRIVLPSNPIPSERYAAEELQRYLERTGGARIPIISDGEPLSPKEILLGDNAHLRSLGVDVDFKGLGAEGFVLKTYRDYLIIAGGRPRGTLYGVYTLLEEKLGVRWFTPELEFVPSLEKIGIPDLDETKIPVLEYREVFWTEMMRDPDFAARHRLNGNHYRLTEKHGGRAVVYFPFVHTFDALIPRELYEEHPEYFPFINGKRVDGYVQRCLSNPDVLKIAIERVRQWIREHPDVTIVSVSQNDTGNWCQCDQCKALDDAEGSPSASIINFVNRIGEAIEDEHPNVSIDTLAYQYSRKPPKTIRPRKNVIVRLCSIECCFSHPLESCPSLENRLFREDITTWEPIAPKLYVWDYTTNFANYIQPFPNLEVLQENVRFFVRHGVKGIFEQGNYSGGGNGEMAPLRAYLLAKLLWDPDTDVKRHMDEFLKAYFGKASDKIRSYIELLHRQVKENGFHAHIFDPPSAPYLSEKFIKEADMILEDAERMADDEEIRFRVRVARLPVWYVMIATKMVDGVARDELISRFLAVARKAGITNISEGLALEEWAKRVIHSEGGS